MKKLTTQGFTYIEVILVAIVFTGVSTLGWWVYHSGNELKKTKSTSEETKKAAPKTQPNTTELEPDALEPGTVGVKFKNETGELSDASGKVRISYPLQWVKKDIGEGGDAAWPGENKNYSLAPQSVVDQYQSKYGDDSVYFFNVTFFRSNSTPKEVYETVLGGSHVGKEVTVSGYPAYYAVETSNSYVDKTYVVISNGSGVYLSFRESERHYTPQGEVDDTNDYSAYTPDFGSLVNSIVIN